MCSFSLQAIVCINGFVLDADLTNLKCFIIHTVLETEFKISFTFCIADCVFTHTISKSFYEMNRR